MEWWQILLIWWVGMIPAGWAAGRAQVGYVKTNGKPAHDVVMWIFVGGWPVVVLLFPIVLAHLWAQRKPKTKAPDGNAKR